MDKAPGFLAFRIGSIPIELTPAFVVSTVAIASTRSLVPWMLVEWLAVVFVSVLVHELGHALAARSFGCSARVELHGLGGTTFHEGGRLSAWSRMLISLAGPFAGIVLGAIVYGVSRRLDLAHPVLGAVVADALWVSWGYGLLNLLPMLPLDGGHVMQELVELVSQRKNERAALVISIVTASTALAIAVARRSYALMFLLAWIAVKQAARAWALYEAFCDRPLAKDEERLRDLLTRFDGVAITHLAGSLLDRARSDRVKALAVEALAWGHLYQDELDAALRALLRMPTTYQVNAELKAWLEMHVDSPHRALETSRLIVTSSLERADLDAALAFVIERPRAALDAKLLADVEAALFYAGRYLDSLRLSELLANEWGSANGAYNAACALVHLGRMSEAFAWLDRAVTLGYQDRASALADEDLAPLRSDPRFVALLERLPT